MKYLVFSLFFVLFPKLLNSQNDTPILLSKVTPEGGVVHSQINSILEDNRGFIWFSTYNGLFSYDAITIKRYSYLQKDSTSISTNRINLLFKDNKSNIWIGTENGLCTYNTKKDNFVRHSFKDQFGNEAGKNILSFFQDHNQNFWFLDETGFGTLNPENNTANYKQINKKITAISHTAISEDGTIWIFYEDGDIYFLNKDSHKFQFFKKGLNDTVTTVFKDGDFIWIGYQSSGLVCLNLNNDVTRHYTNSGIKKGLELPGNRVRKIIKDDKNQIWVATENGIAIFKDQNITFIVDKQKYSELPHQSIYALYKDSNKNIWIGTWLGGLVFESKYNASFQHFTMSTSRKSISSNVVSCFAQVPNTAQIMVGTDDGSLNLYNPKTNLFTNYPVISNGDTIKRFKSLTYDKNGTLWAGTYRNGVLYQKKNEKSFKRLNPPFPTGIQILDMLATNDGIWISNYRLGVYFYQFETDKFTQYKHNEFDAHSISNNNIRHIIQDKNENIWFATENGLNLLKKDSSTFIRAFHQAETETSISSNYIYALHEDKNGFLWLGTNGEGLDKLNPKTLTAVHFTTKEGLTGNEIFSILQDKNDDLWLTTENGLCKFDSNSKNTQSFISNKGIQNNHFYPLSALQSNDSELYFGGTNGLIRFQPSAIINNPIPPKTTITQLLIYNKKITPETEDGILSDVISATKKIHLRHKQNSINFEFTSNNYINPTKNKFKYRLVNFNNTWIESDYKGQAYFTNVPPGNYVFEVKAANNYGIWNENPTQVAIIISPAIWLTWYAYLLYFLIVIILIYLLRKQAAHRQKLKLAIKMSEIQRETEDELHQLKLQFFTNISHEFRTPLTLIQGPINRLLKAGTENDLSRKQLLLIKNNTDRLLRLINQFLDFRRIDHGKLKLSPIHEDVILFSKNVFNCFEEHAAQRSFNFNFISEFSSLKMDFDTDKLDKVLVNLLSNAFKYSADEGNITLKISKNNISLKNKNWASYVIGTDLTSEFLEICIMDTGYGIAADELPKIFERFFQIEKNHNNVSSTGIGLSLLTNYVGLHNGQLVVNTLEGEGTSFYIYLPLKQENTFLENPKEPANSSTFNYSTESVISVQTNLKNEEPIDNQESLILIVEDNLELLDFLEESLQNHFRIAKAKNGKEALDLTSSLYPDLIISDVMMPIMDGIQLCAKIKNDIRTSHIPFILLTALSTVQDKISGVQSGADAYIPKPFDEEFLVAQVNNLLNSRKTLRALFASQQEDWNENNELLTLDKKLLQKAIYVIEKNITNAEFTVEDLAKNLSLSRTHLHRKLKSLTNQSATEFIRNIRLKHAIKLMKSGDYLINEIGFAVGFNSHNYFTKAFKKQFGISPTEFIKKNFEVFKATGAKKE